MNYLTTQTIKIMKMYQLIISIISLAILVGCQTPQSSEVEVSILIDITSSTNNEEIDVTTNDILKFFDFHKNPYNYGKFRISTLTEAHLSKIKQIQLPQVVSMDNYNKYSRENEIKKFNEEVNTLLDEVKNLDKGKQASSLFIPISKELERLAHSDANTKVLVCFTDLFENSSAMFSVYSEKEMQHLFQNPEKLTELLSINAPLPENLHGIKVFLIYNPDIDTDIRFLAISQWYKRLLETKGAEVYIGANLVLD